MVMATTKGQMASKAKTKAPTGEVAVNVVKLKSLLLSAINDAFQQLANEAKGEVDGKPRPAGKAPSKVALEEAIQFQIWEDDPFLEAVDGTDPVPAEPIAVDEPQNDQPSLQTQILDPEPAPGLFQPSTPEFLYWNAASALARGINFWGPLLPGGTQWTTANPTLQVELDAGVDLNAFFARDSGLNFFHDDVDHTPVFSGESPDVVCHELGHAILDAVKPELFDAASMEGAAFHEAFGDMSSMLSALQLPSMRQFVLDQTGGKLNVNSRLSQLARQLGWAIRQKFGTTAADTDCLRNTSNNFFYQDPAGLPPNAPATQLSSEPHSFSRVFSGAFLDVLAGMFQIGPAGAPANDSDKLQTISLDAGRLLIEGVRLAPVGPAFYGQVAAGMIQADQTLNGGRYRAALSSSFVQRGILSPAAAVSLVRDLQVHGGQVFGVTGLAPSARHVQFEGDNEGYKKTARDAPALPVRPLATRFGVTLYVHLPAESNRFGVAAAALAGGSEKTFSPEEDARSFVEDLIQLDEISQENAPGVIPAELTSPEGMDAGYKTHRLVKEDGKTVLKRHHFSCGFPGCKHGR
jgi:hypothetical protein